MSQREEECLNSMYQGLCHPLETRASVNILSCLEIVRCCGWCVSLLSITEAQGHKSLESNAKSNGIWDWDYEMYVIHIEPLVVAARKCETVSFTYQISHFNLIFPPLGVFCPIRLPHSLVQSYLYLYCTRSAPSLWLSFEPCPLHSVAELHHSKALFHGSHIIRKNIYEVSRKQIPRKLLLLGCTREHNKSLHLNYHIKRSQVCNHM